MTVQALCLVIPVLDGSFTSGRTGHWHASMDALGQQLAIFPVQGHPIIDIHAHA